MDFVREGALEVAQDGALEAVGERGLVDVREGALDTVDEDAVEAHAEGMVAAAVDGIFVWDTEGNSMGSETSVTVLVLDTDVAESARLFVETGEAGNDVAVTD